MDETSITFDCETDDKTFYKLQKEMFVFNIKDRKHRNLQEDHPYYEAYK